MYQRGSVWWIQYYDHGHPRNESTGSADEDKARELLRQKVADVTAGRDLTPDSCTVDDLCRLVLADYRLRRLRDAKTVEWRYGANIKPALGDLRAAKVTGAIIGRYIERRRKDDAGDATINRELSILGRGFQLGSQEDPPLVRRVPRIPRLEEDNARQGFLEPEQYEHLLDHMPMRLKALLVCGYHVGTRSGELRKIRVEQVDFDEARIRLEVKQTKGKRARTLPIYGDMERWLRLQIDNAPKGCPWVFYGPRGAKIENHLRGWHDACDAAGMPDLLFHDLRRSAVRNMKRAGIQDKVAMEISGHKTRAIFDRYNIVDEGDIGSAAEKLGEYFGQRKAERAAKLRRVK